MRRWTTPLSARLSRWRLRSRTSSERRSRRSRSGGGPEETVPPPTGPRCPNMDAEWASFEASPLEEPEATRAARRLEETPFVWLDDFAGRNSACKKIAGDYRRMVSDERARQRVGNAKVAHRRGRDRRRETPPLPKSDWRHSKRRRLDRPQSCSEIHRAQRESGAPTPSRWCTICGLPSVMRGRDCPNRARHPGMGR